MDIKQFIQPKEYVFPTRMIDSLEIKIVSLTLFKDVTIVVNLYDKECCIKTECYTLSGEDYQHWNNDDNYILQYVFDKLGVVPLSV